MKSSSRTGISWWLLVWLGLGGMLRFANLGLKPPWSDEWASLVFSLGNSFRSIPLNGVISLSELLVSLQVRSLGTAEVVNNLLTESTHPPLYFVLNHWWLEITGTQGALVSIWWGRCGSALLGTVAIAGMFLTGWLMTRSFAVARLAAALMAVSPFGVYLAQETRHYTLAILWLLGSLACLVVTARQLTEKSKLKWRVVMVWIVVNVLGVATHYFFALALVAQTMVLTSYWWEDITKGRGSWLNGNWFKIYTAIAATVAGCLPWLWLWRSIPDNGLTSWVYRENVWLTLYESVGRILLWLITDIALLPVEGVPNWVAIASGIVLLAALGWIGSVFLRSYRKLNDLSLSVLTRFIVAAIALILLIAVTTGADMSLSARFQFFYYPAWLLLIAIVTASVWQNHRKLPVVVLILLGICGSLSINHNLAFQKVERPDKVVPVMVEAYQQLPVVITIDHFTHGQTGELMSLGWQFKQAIDRREISWQPQFLLLNSDLKISLQEQIQQIEKPFQLWLINFSPSPDLSNTSCKPNPNYQRRTTGYKYRLYDCN